MYAVDGRDTVIQLDGIPQSDVGAPCPVVFSDESATIVAYLMRDAVSSDADDIAFVRFHQCYATMFGRPNDEAISGHPLASRGLEPYGAYRVENSSWIRQLERMNSVHPHHRPERFDALTHFILTFHDSTFECVAESFTVTVVVGPLQYLLQEIDRLRHQQPN